MQANKTVLQMKYARIVKLFAEKAHMPYEEALGLFYDSETYQLISEYLADELLLEFHLNAPQKPPV